MKFLYEYRTSDNERHNGVIRAASRDAAFAALKGQGVHPSRLVDAPGFANQLFGKGKRWIAIGVLAALSCVSVFVIRNLSRQVRNTAVIFDDMTRRQILGDAAIIEKGVRTGWADVFEAEGDRFFASFAIPGMKAAVGTTNEDELQKVLCQTIGPAEKDGLEVRQIKAMVEGMKNEALAFVAAGGSLRQYGKRLVDRQEAELAIYNRAKSELDTLAKSGMNRQELEELWERRNDELRTMGIRLISMPE